MRHNHSGPTEQQKTHSNETYAKSKDRAWLSCLTHLVYSFNPGEATRRPGEATRRPGEATRRPGEATRRPGAGGHIKHQELNTNCTFLVPTHPLYPGLRAVKWVCCFSFAMVGRQGKQYARKVQT